MNVDVWRPFLVAALMLFLRFAAYADFSSSGFEFVPRDAARATWDEPVATKTSSSPQFLVAAATDDSSRWDDFSDRWHFKFDPAIWFSGIDATLGRQGRQVRVNKDFSDLASNVSLAAILDFEISKGPLSGDLSGLYYHFQKDGRTRIGGFDTHATTDFSVIDFGLAYQFLNLPLGASRGADTARLSLEFMPGFRWTYVSSDVKIKQGPFAGASAGADRDFFDPYVGGRVRLDLNRHVNLSVRGNYGGWGIGTKSTWAIEGLAEYRFTPVWGVFGGYRVLADHFSRSGFELDATIQGPEIGVSIRW